MYIIGLKYFTEEELKVLLKTIKKSKSRHSERDLVLVKIAYYCGLRSSEVGLLTPNRYNPLTKELYCERLKGSINNTLVLDDNTNRLLTKYIKKHQIKNDEPIFSSQKGNPINRRTLNSMMKRYCIESKVIIDPSKHKFHTLKHSCGTHLANQGLSALQIRAWLSHSSISSSLIYISHTSKQHQLLLDKLKESGGLVKVE